MTESWSYRLLSVLLSKAHVIRQLLLAVSVIFKQQSHVSKADIRHAASLTESPLTRCCTEIFF